MENTNQVTIPPMYSAKSKTNKGVLILLVIIVMVLAAAVGIMLSKLSDQKKETISIQEVLEGQKQRLENDLTDLQDQFGALQTNNDSLKTLASTQQERITKLLAISADNAYKIKMYQKELETLRGVLRSYIIQVDSLNTSNEALKAQNTDLAKNLAAERAQSSRLTVDKEKLTTTVQKAQILSASDIVTTGSTGRRETDRALNIEKLKTCFTVRENPVAAAGERVFYLVIVKPDKNVLINKSNDTFPTQEGSEIVYTDKRTIEYENKDIEMCIFTDNDGRLTAGSYGVSLYCDGYLVGTSTFVLK
jgi:FtsZ-binding cell division protein ZapB